MSKRINSTPKTLANCRVTSVLPTPVGPAKRNEPIVFCASLSPARDNFIADARAEIASSCPKTSIFRFFSRLPSLSISLDDTDLAGTLAIFETISSISATSISCLRSASAAIRCLAPASSITSIALSGKCLSVI